MVLNRKKPLDIARCIFTCHQFTLVIQKYKFHSISRVSSKPLQWTLGKAKKTCCWKHLCSQWPGHHSLVKQTCEWGGGWTRQSHCFHQNPSVSQDARARRAEEKMKNQKMRKKKNGHGPFRKAIYLLIAQANEDAERGWASQWGPLPRVARCNSRQREV